MRIRVNGQDRDMPDACTTVAELLAALGIRSDRVAVELNGAIVAPSCFTETALHDRDRVEIVSFVGGG